MIAVATNDPYLGPDDCGEIAQALRVFAHQLQAECRSEMEALPAAVRDQAERLEAIAARLDEAKSLDWSYEAVLALIETARHGGGAEGVTVFDFSPEELRVAAAGLRLLWDRLFAAGDQHARRLDELATRMESAAAFWGGRRRAMRKIELARERIDARTPAALAANEIEGGLQ